MVSRESPYLERCACIAAALSINEKIENVYVITRFKWNCCFSSNSESAISHRVCAVNNFHLRFRFFQHSVWNHMLMEIVIVFENCSKSFAFDQMHRTVYGSGQFWFSTENLKTHFKSFYLCLSLFFGYTLFKGIFVWNSIEYSWKFNKKTNQQTFSGKQKVLYGLQLLIKK